MDTDIRALELLSKENPSDQWARYRYRVALVRAGRGEEAGIEVGDEVEIGPSKGGHPWRKNPTPVKARVMDPDGWFCEEHYPWLFVAIDGPDKTEGGAHINRALILIHPSKPSEVGT